MEEITGVQERSIRKRPHMEPQGNPQSGRRLKKRLERFQGNMREYMKYTEGRRHFSKGVLV